MDYQGVGSVSLMPRAAYGVGRQSKYSLTGLLVAAYAALLFFAIVPETRPQVAGFQTFPSLWIVPILMLALVLHRDRGVHGSLVAYSFVFVWGVLVASLFSGSTWSTDATKWIVSLGCFTILASALQTRQDVYLVTLVAVTAVSLICLVGTFRSLSQGLFYIKPFGPEVEGNRNTLSLWTAGVLPVALAMGTDDGISVPRRIFWLGCFFVMAVAQLFALNRSGWIVAGASVLGVFVLKRQWRVVLLMMVIGVAVWWVALSVLPHELIVHLEIRVAEASLDALLLGEAGRSLEYRIDMLQWCWRVWMQHPITGSGFGSFATTSGRVPHNVYAKTLAEQGLLGITVLLAGLWIYIKKYATCVLGDEDPMTVSLGLGLLVGSVALMFRGAGADVVFFTPIAYLVFALGWSLGNMERVDAESITTSQEGL